MKKFDLIKDFAGYINKRDVTNTSIRHLVSGSQNVVINDGEKVEGRKGFTLLGSEGSSTGIYSEYVFKTRRGEEIMLRAYDDELEFYTSSIGDWTRLSNGWTSTEMDFTTWWDSTEQTDLLLFVAQNSSVYEWSGAIAEISSTTSNSITKTGTETWAEAGFYTGRDKTVIINGTEYTYTGGESTTTLTGVSPDPTGEANGSTVFQKIVTNTNTPGSGATNDSIKTLNNQVHIGDYTNREIFVSSNSDFTDFTPSANRLPGEGFSLTLDDYFVGFIPQEDRMYITAGLNDWYQVVLTLSDDLQNESVQIKKLKSAPYGAAKEKDLIHHIKNDVVFVSNEPTLDSLGRIENINTPQSRPYSDAIKVDFDAADFSGGDIQYWKNKLYITAPNDSKMWIMDIEKGFWNPPQILSIKKLSLFEGSLYGHSDSSNETYKLFDGNTDNGAPIEYVSTFAYRNSGERANLKNFDEYYSEVYMSLGTTLTLELLYDYKGSRGSQTFEIDSTNDDLRFDSTFDASLGKAELGKEGLGSSTESLDNLSKYRHYAVTRPTDFFEYQAVYKTSDLGAEFEILAHGPNTILAGRQDNKLRS